MFFVYVSYLLQHEFWKSAKSKSSNSTSLLQVNLVFHTDAQRTPTISYVSPNKSTTRWKDDAVNDELKDCVRGDNDKDNVCGFVFFVFSLFWISDRPRLIWIAQFCTEQNIRCSGWKLGYLAHPSIHPFSHTFSFLHVKQPSFVNNLTKPRIHFYLHKYFIWIR